MLTRREVVIDKPFQDRRYRNHRRKVRSALPRIDTGPPQHFPHLDVKLKKLRLEKDRQDRICEDNIRLIHRLAIIMRTKRMDDINLSPKGPFETHSGVSYTKRRKGNKSSKVKGRTGNQSSPPRLSFLEEITKEAIRLAPPPIKFNTIQHRAPSGFCKVPQIGLDSLPVRGYKHSGHQRKMKTSTRLGRIGDHESEKRQRDNRKCSICTGNLVKSSQSPKASSYEVVPCKCSTSEISRSSNLDIPTCYSSTIVNSSNKIENYSEDEKDTGKSNSSTEKVDNTFSDSKKEVNTISLKKEDSDEQVSSILLGQTPSINVDDASDDYDFFK